MNLRSLTRVSAFATAVFFAALGSMTSCVSPKTIVYFQGDTLRYSSDSITQRYVPLIQSNDLLSIIVGSLSAEANEIFNAANMVTTATTTYGINTAGAGRQPVGYLVDSDGNIELPMVGKVKVVGLITQVAADTIRQRLLTYLREPTVTVRTLNFKVSVVGEVNRPAVYVIPDEKIALPEVLSMAGDLTIYGKRDNVLVIREEDGRRQYARVDLTSRQIFNSPYYYLHKNDIVYVEPVKAKIAMSDNTRQLLPFYVSILTAVSLILLRINF
ncbi:polysaccharide export outer membrane protein [Rhabdobacter roseus]|uniref:Polysaccharide export outer membrane protein n=1 Tax=Rhabdobacter roseus TaxID=1655419 RepID=A0A840TTV8_9BACT|nr:polysaccharide biosynthesis/export family protein [Rhabdobacter roseus]MBB5284703.1 polysaccharide export outer membrane protein [Rhabdobacter roseus]